MSERSRCWLSHLSAIEAEGITTKTYSERDGLSPQARNRWRKRLLADGSRSRAKLALGGFLLIQIEQEARHRRGASGAVHAEIAHGSWPWHTSQQEHIYAQQMPVAAARDLG